LLNKGYFVHAIKRRSWFSGVYYLCRDIREKNVRYFIHYSDLTDATNLIRIIQGTNPNEIHNLATQSHIEVSFKTPEYTANADVLRRLLFLEAIRILKLEDKIRFHQVSTSELYGKVQEIPQCETTQPLCGSQALYVLDPGQLM